MHNPELHTGFGGKTSFCSNTRCNNYSKATNEETL